MGTHHILINEIFKLKISTDIDWKMETERNINRVSGNKNHRQLHSKFKKSKIKPKAVQVFTSFFFRVVYFLAVSVCEHHSNISLCMEIN